MDTLLVASPAERALGLPDRVLLDALDYVLRERVVDTVRLGSALGGRVLGARDEYRAEVTLDPFAQVRCSCRLHPPCRHAAAVAVAYLRAPEGFAQLPEEGVLGRSVFALVAGWDAPLAPLLRPVRVAGDVTEPDWSALAAGGRAAVGRLVPWLEAATDGGRRALDPAVAERLARTLADLLPDARERVGADGARALADLYAHAADPAVAAPLGVLLGSLGERARDAARIRLERTAWEAHEGRRDHADDGHAAMVEARAVEWLCDDAQSEGGPEAGLAVARAHRGLAAAALAEARCLLRLGRADEAARVAEGAYLHAEPQDAARLYALLRDLGMAGHAGVLAFLQAAWEALPDRSRLDDLLAMGDAATRARTLAAAEAVLARRHRFDDLTRLCREADDLEAAVRWALRDGIHAAPPDVCADLADAVAAERPLLALELLGAAYRREGTADRRRRLLARARSIVRPRSDLAEAWPILRRRWFSEGTVAAGRP